MTRPLGAVRTSATHWSILVWMRTILSTGRRRRGFLAAQAALQGREARVLCQCTILRAGPIIRRARSWLRFALSFPRAASPCLPTSLWVSVTRTVNAPGIPAPLQSRGLGALDSLLFWGQVAALASCWKGLGPSGRALIRRQWDSLLRNLASRGTRRRLHICLTLRSWKPLLGSIFTDNGLGNAVIFSIGETRLPPLAGSNKNWVAVLPPKPFFLKRYENVSRPGRKGARAIGAVMPVPATCRVVVPAGLHFVFEVVAATVLLVGLSWSLGRISTFGTRVLLIGIAIRAKAPAPYGSQVEILCYIVSTAVVLSSHRLRLLIRVWTATVQSRRLWAGAVPAHQTAAVPPAASSTYRTGLTGRRSFDTLWISCMVSNSAKGCSILSLCPALWQWLKLVPLPPTRAMRSTVGYQIRFTCQVWRKRLGLAHLFLIRAMLPPISAGPVV